MTKSPLHICSKSIAALLFASISLTASQRSEAAPTNWTGGSDSSWDTALNWSLGVEPTAADAVTFGLLHPTGTAISLTTGELANTLTFSDAGYSLTGGSLMLTAGSETITVDPTFTASIASILDGTNVTKAGTGTLVLSGANTYTGRTILSAGTLSISQDGNLGAAPGGVVPDSITFDGGLLRITGATPFTLNSNRGITINTGVTGTMQVVDSANTVSYAGAITGAAGTTFKKTGAGTLDLRGDSSAALFGALNVDGGTLKISGAGTLAGASGVTLGNRATLTLDNSATNLADRTAGNFTSTGGTLNFIGNATATTETLGAVTLNAGALTINSTAGAGGSTLTIPSITRNPGGVLSVSGTGLGGGTNQVVLTTANALTNTILPWAVVNNGTVTRFATHGGDGTSLAAQTSGYTAAETAWTVNTVNALPTADQTLTGNRIVNSLTLDDTIDLLAPSADRSLTIGSGGVGAVLQTGGSSIVNASGTNGVNLLFGANEALFHVLGTLTLNRGSDNTNLVGTGGFTKSGAGTLLLNGLSSLTGAFNVNEGILEVRSATALMATTATMNLNGATLRLSNDSSTTYTGNVAVNADSTIQVDRVTAAATATTHTLGTLSIGGGRTLSVTSNDITAGTAYGLTFTGAATFTGPATLDVANNGAGLGTLTISTVSGAFPLTKAGAGDLVLSNVAAVYSGLVDIQGGRVGWSPGSGTLTENSIFSGAGGLFKNGNGTVNLTATSTFTGGINVTGGTLGFSTVSNNGGGSSNLGQGTDGLVLNGGTLNFIGTTSQSTNRAMTLPASSTLNAAGTGGATITYAGPITAGTDFSLTLTGTGGGSITGGITQPLGTSVADLNVNSGTWTLSGATSTISDDVIVTGSTAVLNLNTTGVLAYAAGTVNGLYARTDAVINLGAHDVTGVANSGGVDFVFLGDTGVGTLNSNGFNLTMPRLDIGDDDNLIDSGIVTGSGTFTVTTDFNLYRGSISANLVGAGAIEKYGLGDVILSGDNSGLTTASSTTRVDLGNLILDYTTNNATKLSATNSLDMRGGTLTLNGNASADTTQNVLALTLASGGFNTINVNSGGAKSATLNLGAITRTTGTGTIRFGLPVSGAITTTTGNLGTTGTLGGWATATDATGTYFAKNDGSNNIVIVPTTTKNDVSTWAAGEQITDDTTGFTGTTGSTIGLNSLRFNAAGPSTVTIGNGQALGVNNGGVLQTSNVTGGTSLITGGKLASGASAELIFTTDSPSQLLTVASTITGNESITKTGNGTLRLTGNNNYTGSTRLQAGTLQVSGGNAIGDTSAVPISAAQSTVLELLSNETIGTLSGGANANLVVSEVRLGGNTLTVNQGSSANYAGVLTSTGAGSLIKTGAGNLQFNGATGSGFLGMVSVNSGLFYLTGSTTLGATAITLNKGGSFMIDNNGTTTSGSRILDNATITLNSADGMWSGETRPSGLVIRRDQGSTQSETVGVLTVNSGASYTRLDATVTSALAQIITDNITRSNKATLDVRGTNMSAISGQRAQLRIVTAANQTAFIGAMVGGGSTTLGTKNISLVPWAIAEEYTSGIADTNMGNSLATYVSGFGFRALTLATEYNTYAASAIAAENIRESLAADLTGLTGKTINSLVLHNATTTAATFNVTGTGAGQTLALTSGAMLFTVNTAAAASSANGIVLGGFDSGITVGATNEYVVHVINPSSVATTPTLTATINSPLTSIADITKSGRGTLILTGTNTAGGNTRRTTINEGVLQIADLDNIGGNTGDLVFAGGTLRIGTGFVDDLSTRNISFLQGGGSLDTNGLDLTLANSLGSGIGGFTKFGLGNLILNAAATYTGSTTISAGSVTLGAAQAIGTGPLTVSGGVTLAMGANSATVAGLTVSNAANILSGSGTLTVNGDATVNRGTIAPLLAGSMNLIKQTASQTVTLSNTASTFTGFTQVQDGTLSIASVANSGIASSLGAATGDNAAIRLGNVTTTGILAYTGGAGSTNRLIVLPGTTGGGTIDGGGTDALTLSGNITGTEYGAKTLTLQGTPTGFTNVLSGIISNGLGTVGVTKAGAGLWSLTGTNTYTGPTTLTAGTLVISNNNNLGSTAGTIAPVTFNGGTLRYATGATNTDISGRTVTLTGTGTIDTNGQNVTYANPIGNAGAGGLTKTGAGTLTLAGSNAYSGVTTVTSGTLAVTGTITATTGNITVANAAGNAVLNVLSGATMTGGILTVGTVNGAVGAVNITGGTLNMLTPETQDGISFGAANGGYGALTMSSGTFTQSRFMFGGTSSTTGTGGIGMGLVTGGTVNTNGFIIIARHGASTGVLTLANGTINHTGASQDLHIGYQGTGRAEVNLLGGLIDNSGRNVKFGGGTWTGTGIANLNGGTLKTNLFTTTGTSYLNFNGGTLKANISSASFLPALSAVNVNGAFGTYAGGAVIDTNTFDVTVAANLLAPAGNGVSTIAVADGGSGYIGAPYVSISGGTGATAIANMVDDGTGNGTLKVGSITVTNPGTGYSGTPTYTFTSGGAAVAATAGAVATAPNTSGGLTKLSAGTLTLSGTNTFGGAVNVNGGTLAFSTSANLGDATKSTNTLAVNGGTLDYTSSGALDLGANRVLTIGVGGATINAGTAAATLTFSGGVANGSSGNLAKSGAGSVILSGTTNLNGGTTTVSGGLLRTGFGAAGTSAVSVAAGATLQNVDPSATTLVLPNTGSLTLDAGATLATASTLGFGLNASTASGITLTSGGTLAINGTGTVFVDLLSLGTPLSTAATYNLLSVPGGGLLTGSGGPVSYALNDVIGGYTYTLNQTSTLISVNVSLFAGSLYWHGDLTGPAGSWSDYRSGNTNWRNAATGGTDISVNPGSATRVVFSATEATGPSISTTLDGDVTIRNLQFTSNPVGVTSVTIAQGTGGALTIAPALSTDGLEVADNAGAITISAPVVVGADQTWNVAGTGANGSSLTVSGGVTGFSNITKTGAGTLTLTAANSTYNGDIIWGGGGLTMTPTGTGANNLVFNGVISGSGSGPLLKDGSGNLVLNGANTYSGGTTLNGGTTILGNKQAFGSGTVTTSTNTPTLQASVDLSGVNAVANNFLLDSNLTVSGTNNLEITGTTTTATSARTLTNNLTGPATLTLTGNVILGSAGALQNLTVSGTGSTVINGVVVNAPVAGGWLVKAGTGTLTLGAPNTYTGFTIIDLGTLILAPGVDQNMANTFYFGSGSAATSAGTLDLTNANATFGSFIDQINSNTNTPTIKIGPTKSLTINGNATIGTSSLASTTTLLTATGGGTMVVNNAAASGFLTVGGATGSANQGNRAIADLSGLSGLTVTLNTSSGFVRVNPTNSNNVSGKYSTLTLPSLAASVNSITASQLAIGDSGQNDGSAGQVNALLLGSGAGTTNTIKVDTINIGTGARDLGSLSFNGGAASGGSVTITNAAGTGAAALNLGTGSVNTGVSGTNTGVTGLQGDVFDVTGHTAALSLAAVNMGTQNRGVALSTHFRFDTGTLTMASLRMSTRTGDTTNGGGLARNTTSTMNLGGGTVNITNGITAMASASGTYTATNPNPIMTATVNISGGTVNIGATGSTSISMASNTASGGSGTAQATALLNLTGGVTTLAGDIVKVGGTAATSATVTHAGGTLDMSAKSIGTALNPVTLDAESGTLQNLGELNGGGTLTKTTAGTLTIAGTNGYTGPTSVEGGTLQVNGSINGGVATVGAATLAGMGSIGGSVTVNNGGILAPGASIGSLATGALSMAAGSTFALEINTSSVAGLIGASDRVVSSGALTLDLTTSPVLTLSDLGANIALTEGTTFTFITYSSGNWNGGLFSFGGNAIDDDVETFSFGANTYKIDYNASGNSAVQLLVVPEPGTGASLLGGLGVLLGLQRFRRRRTMAA